MKTIRRLYFYSVAFISIEVVVWGIIGLLRSIINSAKFVNGASTLAEALSLILVGVPIFLVHWFWAQRSSASDEEEKTASLRAVFLYGILLGTLLPVIQNLLALIDRTFINLAKLYDSSALFGGSQTWIDNLIAILINLLLAAYFWNVLNFEWRTLPEKDNFSEVRRLYRFIWMLYGLLMVVFGSQLALDFAFTLSARNVLGDVGLATVVNATALLFIGTPVWFFSWRVLQDALPDPAEKESYLRLGILYLLSLGGVIVVLTSGGRLIYLILLQIFGAGKDFTGFIQDIGSPISIGVPFAVLWAYYGMWLNRQFAFDEDAPRRASKQRLYFYILAFLGLAASFYAVDSLLSIVVDQITSKAYLSSGGFVMSLSSALAALIVGLPLWLLTWRPMQAEALSEGVLGEHARRSIIRRSYLYLALFVGVLGGMASAGGLVFTLINAALGGSSGDFLNSLLSALENLILFVVLALYHLSTLRKDTDSRADVLEDKQQEFKLLVLDNSDGKFGESVKAIFAKRAPKVPVTVINAKDAIPTDVKADALLLPGSLSVNPPGHVSAWISSFSGSRLIVPDEAAGVFWLNDLGQAADSAKALAEGEELRPQSATKSTPVWTYVAYVFAALFACQILFALLAVGISLITGF